MRASSRDDVRAWRSAQARRTSASTDRHVSTRMLMLRHVLQAASTGLPLHDSKTAARMDVGGVDDIAYKNLFAFATGSEPGGGGPAQLLPPITKLSRCGNSGIEALVCPADHAAAGLVAKR